MTMTTERFRELIEAYGADPRRWPEAERAEAAEAARAPAAQALLAEARALDGLLAEAPAIQASAALRDRVLAAAPTPRRRLMGRLTPLAWLSGFGWAAAAAAGLVFGVALGQQVLVDWRTDVVLEQASAWSLDETEYLG